MRRTAVALLGVILALLGACGIPTDGEPRPLADQTTVSTASPEPEEGDTTAAVYLLTNDERLAPRRRAIAGDKTPQAVLEALLLQTSEEEEEAGLRTAIPPLTTVLDVAEEGGVLTVDMSAEWETLELPNALFAYAQVVLTLTELPGVDAVRFLIDGEPVDSAPTVNQVPSEVVEADDYATLKAT